MYKNFALLGVFEGVRSGLAVSAFDVEAAVNCICEESYPFEIPLTKYD